MAILANDGRWALETTSPFTYKVNNTNLGSQTTVTGVADSLYTNWAGVYGSQLNLPYNSINSNSFLNLYARHMGGWATVDLGTDAADRYDTVALNRTGDWVLNFQGGDKLIAGASVAVSPSATAYIPVNAYVTSNASFNTDGSLKIVAGTSGTQNVSFEAGLTGNQNWDRIKNNPGWGQWTDPGRTDNWTVTGAVSGVYSTTQHDNNEQSGANTGVGLTENTAGDVNQTSTVTLGDGNDNLMLLNNTRTVTDYWWQSFWIFGGRWNSYTYRENAWTIYRDGADWKAYNNFKDYTVTIKNDVETVYFQHVNDDGSFDYQVYNNDGTVDHYTNGFPPLPGSGGGGGGGGPTKNDNPTNPLSLGEGGFNPDTDTDDNGGSASIQVLGPRGAKVAFYSTKYHNAADTLVNQATLAELTVLNGGAQTINFLPRDSGSDGAGAELGVIRLKIGESYGDSQYHLYLGNTKSGDTADLTSTATMKVVAYGFGGNDVITGSKFNDTLVGGAGDDQLNGGMGADKLYGNIGNDKLDGGVGLNWVDGGANDDTITGITAGSIGDTLMGGDGVDHITGGVGDFVQGGAQGDTMIAGAAAGDGTSVGTTYFVDNEGNNTITTNGGLDAVYFSASNKGSYTNTINNGGSEVVTMLIEHGSTTRSFSDTNFTADDKPTTAYVYVPDAQNIWINATGAGTSDVVNFYGGDRYDVGYWDKTVNTVLFGTWFQWRNYYTVDGRSVSGNNFSTLTDPSLVADWASDGEIYYGSPSGILAPWDPDVGRIQYGSAQGFSVATVGYKGYFTFYNSRVNTTAIYYVNAGSDAYVSANTSEMTYLGMMNGQAGSSVKYGSFVNGLFSLGDTEQAATVPLAVVEGIDLAEEDDSFVSGQDYNDDNITMNLKNLTLTAQVASGVGAADVTVYDWDDKNNNGNIDTGELTTVTVNKGTNSVVGNLYTTDIDLTDGVHRILMTQKLGTQTSDLDPGSALTITVKSDFTPPEFTAFTASSNNDTKGQLNVTVNENVSLKLVAVSDGTVLGSAVNATKDTQATIEVTEQNSVWTGVVKATDLADNSTLSDVTVNLGTTDPDTINVKGAFNAVYGFGGNDKITSAEGKDSLFGGAGSDTINSGTGDDLVGGGSGQDTIVVTGTSSETSKQFNWTYTDPDGTFDLTDGSFDPWSRNAAHKNSTEFGGGLPTEWSIYVGANNPTSFTVDFNRSPYIHIVGWDLSNNFMRIDGSLSSSPMLFANVQAFQDYVTSSINNIRAGSRTAANSITWSYDAVTGIIKASVGEAGLIYDNTGSWNAFDHSYFLKTTGGASTLSLNSSDTIDGGSEDDTLDISSVSGATVTDAMLTNVTSVESLKLGSGNDTVTLSAQAAEAGITKIDAGSGDDTIDITSLTINELVLGSGSNKVKMSDGAVLSGTVSASSGTSTLEIASNAKITLTAAAYNLFNTTGITAAGTEQITLSTALTAGETLDADVETFVLASGSNSVTSGNSGQTINATALTDGQVLTLAGSHKVNVTLIEGDLTSTSSGNITVNATTGSNVITTGAGNDVISAGDGADIITGGAGIDNLSGDEGDDLFILDSANDGGVGENYDGGIHANGDTLRVTGTTAIDFTDDTVNNIEIMDLTGAGAQSVTISLADRLEITTIDATVVDSVTVKGEFTNSLDYAAISQGDASITLDDATNTVTLDAADVDDVRTGGAKFAADDVITISDTETNLAAVLNNAIDYDTSTLGGASVQLNDSADNAVSITEAQAANLLAATADVTFANTEAITITGEFDATDNYTNYDVGSLGGASVTLDDATNTVTLDAADADDVRTGGAKFAADDVITISDTETNLAAVLNNASDYDTSTLGGASVQLNDSADNAVSITEAQAANLLAATADVTFANTEAITITGEFDATDDYTNYDVGSLGGASVTLDDATNTVTLDAADADAVRTGGAKFAADDVITISDTETNLAAVLNNASDYDTSTLGGASVQLNDSADNAVSITEAQAANLLAATANVTFANTEAITITGEFDATDNYTNYDVGSLGGASVTLDDATNTVTLDAADADDVRTGGAKFAADDVITISDTETNLAAVLNNASDYDTSTLGGASVQLNDSADNAVSITEAQAANLLAATADVTFANTEAITITGEFDATDNYTNYDVGSLGGASVTLDDATNTVTLDAADADDVRTGGAKFAADDVITVAAIAAGDEATSLTNFTKAALGGTRVILDAVDNTWSISLAELNGLDANGQAFAATDTVTVTGTTNADTVNLSTIQALNDTKVIFNAGLLNDSVIGTKNNDLINGDDGNDTLNGGLGIDTLNGGAGSDSFVFQAGQVDTTNTTNNMDVIDGFTAGADSIDLSGFTGYTANSAVVTYVAEDDWILSWTSGAGPTTNYVYLKDTGTTAGLSITDTGGVLTASVATGLTAAFAADGSITFTAPEAGTASLIRYGTNSRQAGTNDVVVGAAGPLTYMVLPTTRATPGDLAFLQFQPSGGNTRSLVPDTTSYVWDGTTGADTINLSTTSLPAGATKIYTYGHGGNDTITGFNGADIIFGGAGADEIKGGAGADTIDVGVADNATDLVVYTASGETQTGLFANGGATADMDVISSLALGDKLKLWNVFSGAVTPVTTFLTTAAVNQAAIVRGAWNGTNFSQGNAVTDDDYIVQWADGTKVHSLVLKDYGINASGLTVDVAADTLTVNNNTSPVLTLPSAFANPETYNTGSIGRSVTSADVNKDGSPDLIVTNTGANGSRYGGTVSVLLNKNDGSGTFNAATNTPVGEELIATGTVDVNNDGWVDLVVTDHAWDTVTVLINDTKGNFPTLGSTYLTGNGKDASTSPNNGGPTSISVADLDADNDLDLVVPNLLSNTVAVMMNNGDGTFATMVEYPTGSSPWSGSIADVNGDNKLDLVVANSGNSTVSVLINNGTGTFSAKVDYATGSNPQSITTADVNGDGKADLLVSNRSSNTVSVLINKGDGSGTFNAKVDYATGSGPVTVSSADINGDGKLDILVTNNNSNTVSVLSNKGDGTFNAKTDIVLNTGPFFINSADVNGDGTADLLVSNWSGSVSVLRNTSTSVFTEGTPVLVNSGLSLSDADGDADWDGGTLTVDITVNNTADDRLVLPVTDPGGSAIWLDTTANNALMAGSTVIGDADATEGVNGTAWTFTFNNSATNTLVQSLARSIKFDNQSDTPSTATRTISFTATDKGGLSASIDVGLTVIAVTDHETINGTAFADTLISDAGNDTLIGGAGADDMTGGLGNDVFVIGNTDSGVNPATADIISDFVSGVDDLKLGVLGTDGAIGGNFSALEIIGTTGNDVGGADVAVGFANGVFDTVLRYLYVYDSLGGVDGYLVVDTDLDGTANYAVTLTGLRASNSLVFSDIIA